MATQEELIELLIDGARFGDADDVQRALEGKVDVNAQDEWGKTGALMGMAGRRRCRRRRHACRRQRLPSNQLFCYRLLARSTPHGGSKRA